MHNSASATHPGRYRRPLSLLIAAFAIALALVGGILPNTTPKADAATGCGAYGQWAYNREISYSSSQSWCMVYGGNIQLVWQADGNLVAYRGVTATWATNTSNRGRTLKFQADGNVVIYNAHGLALWATNSSVNIKAYGYTLEFVPSAPKYIRVNFYQYGQFRNERVRICIQNGQC